MRVDLIHGDCLQEMQKIPDKSIDLILCDLPYGQTSSKWDKMIDPTALWGGYKRIIKDRAAIVLFGAEPFASKMRLSNPEMYKYDWVWVKNQATGQVNAKLKPMSKHEYVMVFSTGKTANCNVNNMWYYPQGLVPYGKMCRSGNKAGKDNTYWRPSHPATYFREYTNYPTTILQFNRPINPTHPTQKPVDLLEYLIKTYTQEGETVLDNCMGSGSTGVACVNTDRNFIGIEKDDHYFEVAKERIENAQKESN